MTKHSRLILPMCFFAALGACSGIYIEQPLSSAPSASFTAASAPSVSASPATLTSPDEPASPAPGGHVYLFRGLIGDIFSRGMDKLADAMNRRGVPAQTYGVFAWSWVADTAGRTYRKDGAPIVLIGHSTGGDNVIAMAARLNDARVPVALLITFDPTPVADPVPPNVERALNIYQSTNPIGGGQIKPDAGFHGHLANVNLREHREIVHITMDKSDTLHALVAAKIMEVVEIAKAKRAIAAAPPPLLRTAAAKPASPQPVATEGPAVPIKYTVPAAAPIVLWDSGTTVSVAPEDSLETIGRKYGAPAWAIAQINNLNGADGIQPGQRLVVPRNAFVPEPAILPENHLAVSARRNAPATKRDARGKTANQLTRAGGG